MAITKDARLVFFDWCRENGAHIDFTKSSVCVDVDAFVEIIKTNIEAYNIASETITNSKQFPEGVMQSSQLVVNRIQKMYYNDLENSRTK